MVKINLILLSLIFLITCNIKSQESENLTANKVINLIKKNVTCNWSGKTVDTFKAGNPDTEVTGIATTFMATLDVLKKANAAGCNLVITHEPTFYNHLDKTDHFGDDAVIVTCKEEIH